MTITAELRPLPGSAAAPVLRIAAAPVPRGGPRADLMPVGGPHDAACGPRADQVASADRKAAEPLAGTGPRAEHGVARRVPGVNAPDECMGGIAAVSPPAEHGRANEMPAERVPASNPRAERGTPFAEKPAGQLTALSVPPLAAQAAHPETAGPRTRRTGSRS